MRRPFRFVSNLKAALRHFRARVATLGGNSGFRFIVPATRTCKRCVPRNIHAMSGSVFAVSNIFSRRHVFPKTIVPLRSGRNRRFCTAMDRMAGSAIAMSLGRPRTNGSLAFRNRMMRSHATAGRRVRRVMGVVDKRKYNYNYNSYKNKYNSNYDSRGGYKYKRYRWSGLGGGGAEGKQVFYSTLFISLCEVSKCFLVFSRCSCQWCGFCHGVVTLLLFRVLYGHSVSEVECNFAQGERGPWVQVEL